MVRPDGQRVGRLSLHRPAVLVTEMKVGRGYFDPAGPWRETTLDGQLHSGELVDDPLLVRAPTGTDVPRIDSSPVSSVDVAATICDAAGLERPDSMQGRSLLPLFKGESPADWRDSIYYHYLEFPGAHSVRRHYGVRTRTHKLIRYYNIDEWELFDLSKDISEKNDLRTELPEVYGSLKKELIDYFSQINGEYPVPETSGPSPKDKPEDMLKGKAPGLNSNARTCLLYTSDAADE